MPTPRPAVLELRRSEIRAIANAGIGRSDVLPFWFGEGDLPAPEPIRRAAADALLAGRTFYTHNLGRPDLRTALAAYIAGLHGAAPAPERLAVSSAGVSALMIAAQSLIAPGDRVVVVTPVWPSLVEIPRILSARVETVSLRSGVAGFELDLDQLLEALTPDTRVLFLNSPNNPTGWTLKAEHRAVILERCRRIGAWIISDDVYERIYFGEAPAAPSFLALADPQDRLISANSFSKSWRMTGFRLGWLSAPAPLVESLGVLIEYNTSCAPDFIQEGALAALALGEDIIAEVRADLRASRDQLLQGLAALEGVEVAVPEGGLYVFFRLESPLSAFDLANDLIAKAGLGLAPGTAFGPEGAGWLRWCFAARPEKNAEGLRRLERYLRA